MINGENFGTMIKSFHFYKPVMKILAAVESLSTTALIHKADRFFCSNNFSRPVAKKLKDGVRDIMVQRVREIYPGEDPDVIDELSLSMLNTHVMINVRGHQMAIHSDPDKMVRLGELMVDAAERLPLTFPGKSCWYSIIRAAENTLGMEAYAPAKALHDSLYEACSIAGAKNDLLDEKEILARIILKHGLHGPGMEGYQKKLVEEGLESAAHLVIEDACDIFDIDRSRRMTLVSEAYDKHPDKIADDTVKQVSEVDHIASEIRGYPTSREIEQVVRLAIGSIDAPDIDRFARFIKDYRKIKYEQRYRRR